MKTKRILISSLVASMLLVGISIFAQVSRPYRNGSVWEIGFIRVKPGMDTAYLNYLASEWKRNQEAAKREGLILSYKVLMTEAHGSMDWNLLLLTEYKDLATMEANEPKAEALAQRIIGDDQKQMQGYKERLEIREVMGQRLAREIVLEPRR
ncbi:MAG: hypothetical protein RMM98_05380 [Acidobacteriota bacterium]|nr:hypothetical protein [Blastocatellia bacterium]MDW8239027.1 hypothetical protein [Acidobacteriota bacterium]